MSIHYGRPCFSHPPRGGEVDLLGATSYPPKGGRREGFS